MDIEEELNAKLAERLRRSAAAFPYPMTPDIAAKERQRLASRSAPERRPARLAFVLTLLFIVFLAAMLVSPARARLLDWIRIGSVRIFFFPPSPTPSLPALSGTPSPQATPTYLQSVLDLAGATTLSEAEKQVEFTIQLPAYPDNIGQPDHVYLQQYDRPAVILVWMEDDQPDQVRMTLTQAPSDTFIFEKYVRKSVVETQVNGMPAVWVEGDYPLVTRSGEYTMTRLVTQGHTLIWTQGKMTFRLESDTDLESAIRIAESLNEK